MVLGQQTYQKTRRHNEDKNAQKKKKKRMHEEFCKSSPVKAKV